MVGRIELSFTVLGMRVGEKQVTVVIPACNEEGTIGQIVRAVIKYGCEVVVVDDGSCDETAEVAREAGARVVSHGRNMGYLEALRTGFKHARGNIFVTMDADGQHSVEDIPRLVEPILQGRADMVVGARERLSSFSEWVITWLTRLRIDVSDASSGFKALKGGLALKMKLRGKCICGTFVLEAAGLGARIEEVRVETGERKIGKSRIAKRHFAQTFVVIRELLRRGY